MNTEMSLESDIAKLTDTQPGTESIQHKPQQNTSPTNVLDILTDAPTQQEKNDPSLLPPSSTAQQKEKNVKQEYKPAKSTKPIIRQNVLVEKATSKRSIHDDIEELPTFIIIKPRKKPASESIDEHRSQAKPEIIEQTITNAADNQQNILDDSMIDINSMPIVFSDQILPPESIENMPVVMSYMIPYVSTSSPITHTEKKTATFISQSTSSQSDSPKKQIIVKNSPRIICKNRKGSQAFSEMLKENTGVRTQPDKPGKLLSIPTSSSSTSRVRKMKNLQQIRPTTSTLGQIQQNLTSEPTESKVMVVTDERGVKSRVLVTPAQLKMFKPLKSILRSKVSNISPIKNKVFSTKRKLVKADSEFIKKANKLRMQKFSPIPTRIAPKSNKLRTIAPKQLPNPVVPPLVPIRHIEHSPIVETSTTSSTKQPNQLIIQDPLGNQTAVTEGQIIALPSGEIVDGQPRLYALVTVDESGNLVPISNDTLMSLDPSLAIDSGNQEGNTTNEVQPLEQAHTTLETMNQVQTQEQQLIYVYAGNQEGERTETAEVHSSNEVQPLEQAHTTLETMNLVQNQEQPLISVDQLILPEWTGSEIIATETSLVEIQPEQFVTEETHMVTTDDVNLPHETQQMSVLLCINDGDISNEIMITGDPKSTQKFLDSLNSGTTNLSNLISATDGNIIINIDGQLITLLKNTINQSLVVKSDLADD